MADTIQSLKAQPGKKVTPLLSSTAGVSHTTRHQAKSHANSAKDKINNAKATVPTFDKDSVTLMGQKLQEARSLAQGSKHASGPPHDNHHNRQVARKALKRQKYKERKKQRKEPQKTLASADTDLGESQKGVYNAIPHTESKSFLKSTNQIGGVITKGTKRRHGMMISPGAYPVDENRPNKHGIVKLISRKKVETSKPGKVGPEKPKKKRKKESNKQIAKEELNTKQLEKESNPKTEKAEFNPKKTEKAELNAKETEDEELNSKKRKGEKLVRESRDVQKSQLEQTAEWRPENAVKTSSKTIAKEVGEKKAEETEKTPEEIPKKADETSKKADETPKKADETPKKADETPKKADETPKKANETSSPIQRMRHFKKFKKTSRCMIINPSSESEPDSEMPVAAQVESIESEDDFEPAQRPQSSQLLHKSQKSAETLTSTSSSKKADLLFVDEVSDASQQLFVPSDEDSFFSGGRGGRKPLTPAFGDDSIFDYANNEGVDGDTEAVDEQTEVGVQGQGTTEDAVEQADKQASSRQKQAKLNKKRKAASRISNRLSRKQATSGLARETMSGTGMANMIAQNEDNMLQQDPSTRSEEKPQPKIMRKTRSSTGKATSALQSSVELISLSDSEDSLDAIELQEAEPHQQKEKSPAQDIPVLEKRSLSTSEASVPAEIIIVETESESEPEGLGMSHRLRNSRAKATLQSVTPAPTRRQKPNTRSHPPKETRMKRLSSAPPGPESASPSPVTAPENEQEKMDVSQTGHTGGPPRAKFEMEPKSLMEQMKERYRQSGINFTGFGIDADLFDALT